MSDNYLQKLHKVKALFFDVDGVLTDGSVTLMPGGEQVRVMNVKDGYVLQLAVKMGYQVVIITGGRSEEVKRRLQGLGVEHIYLGSADKLDVFQEHLLTYDLKAEECLYMGDDIPDHEVMKTVGFAACPQDAVPEIKHLCHYISPFKGGYGCVRDIVEKTLKVQQKWFKPDQEQGFKNFTW